MRTVKDHYGVLGLRFKATQKEITAAYRKHVVLCHPDLHPEDKTATERFIKVDEAFDILRDQDRRAKFDKEHDTFTHLYFRIIPHLHELFKFCTAKLTPHSSSSPQPSPSSSAGQIFYGWGSDGKIFVMTLDELKKSMDGVTSPEFALAKLGSLYGPDRKLVPLSSLMLSLNTNG